MDRINKIIKHELYLEFIEKIKVHEEDKMQEAFYRMLR